MISILFVDDDPILREFASVHLSTEKAAVITAEDGLDALAKIEQHKPDLILLDLEMPRMNGFQFLGHLNAHDLLDHLPVIVATGREDVSAIDQAYEAGAVSFVVKPLNWRQLSYQIRYVHRTFRIEQRLREQNQKARVAAETAQGQARQLARYSSAFLGAALAKHPDLRADAAAFAQAIGAVIAKPPDKAAP